MEVLRTLCCPKQVRTTKGGEEGEGVLEERKPKRKKGTAKEASDDWNRKQKKQKTAGKNDL